MAIQEEELKTILQSETPETDVVDIGSLEQIASTQKQLSQVKESLGSIIDSMAQNQSYVTRAANFWGELATWQKFAGGIILTAPTLAAGIIAPLGVIFAISGVTVVTYTTSSIILDDHHRYNVDIANRLKTGVFGLADVLEVTISALDTIRAKFAEEIDKFKTQNLKLTDNIYLLTEQMESLSNQVEVFVETEKLLRITKEELEKTTETLRGSIEQQTQLIEKNQKELEKVKHQYERSQSQLSEKIIELSTVRTSLSLEVEKAKKVASTLQGTVHTLAGAVIEDTNQRDAFKSRLDSFLTNKEVSFDQVADRICNAERELATVKDELKRSNERHTELLDRHEQQVLRLERINDAVVEEQLKPNTKLTELLNANGFYGIKRTAVPAHLEPPKQSRTL